MIHYNSPEHQKERANVVPLSIDEIAELIKYVNIYEHYTPKAFQERMQRLIWDYENLRHMRETAPVWVDVMISLPPLSGQYLGLMKDTNDIYVCYYKKQRNLFQVYGAGIDPISDMNVTHWQPLPQTPTK